MSTVESFDWEHLLRTAEQDPSPTHLAAIVEHLRVLVAELAEMDLEISDGASMAIHPLFSTEKGVVQLAALRPGVWTPPHRFEGSSGFEGGVSGSVEIGEWADNRLLIEGIAQNAPRGEPKSAFRQNAVRVLMDPLGAVSVREGAIRFEQGRDLPEAGRPRILQVLVPRPKQVTLFYPADSSTRKMRFDDWKEGPPILPTAEPKIQNRS